MEPCILLPLFTLLLLLLTRLIIPFSVPMESTVADSKQWREWHTKSVSTPRVEVNILRDWHYPGNPNFVPCVMVSCPHSNPWSLCRPAILPCPAVSDAHPVVVHTDHRTWDVTWTDNFREWMIIAPSEQMCSDSGRLCRRWPAGGIAWICPFMVSDDCSQALSLDSALWHWLSASALLARFARETLRKHRACSFLPVFISFQSCLEIPNHHVSYVLLLRSCL